MAESYIDEYNREILVDDYGQPVGEVVDSDDGAKVLLSFDGNVIAASSADGQPLDPAGYAVDGDDDLTGRMDALEAARQDDTTLFREAIALQEAQRAEKADAAQEQTYRDIDLQAEALRRMLGRPLLQQEAKTLGEITAADEQAGRQIDLVNAFGRAMDEGLITRGRLETVTDRRNHITDALNESEAADRQQHVAENGPEDVSVDTREGRAALINDAVNGDTESRAYYTSDTTDS
jgi:hypothetical protein